MKITSDVFRVTLVVGALIVGWFGLYDQAGTVPHIVVTVLLALGGIMMVAHTFQSVEAARKTGRKIQVERKKLTLLVPGVLFIAVLASMALRTGREVVLNWCNFEPYDIRFSVVHLAERNRAIQETSTLPAGECQNFVVSFLRVDPLLYYYFDANSDLARWYRGAYEFPLERNSEGEDLIACVPLASGRRVHKQESDIINCTEADTLRGFIAVDASQHDTIPGMNSFAELAEFPIVLDEATGEVWPEPVEAQRAIRELNTTIKRRRAYLESIDSTVPIKYLTGATVEETESDRNLAERSPGVLVTSSIGVTPLGATIPFVAGDIIYEFDGWAIYAPVDLDAALVQFAESRDKGIEKQYVAHGWRDDVGFEWRGAFFFNEDAFPRSEEERQRAREFGSTAGWSIQRIWNGSPVEQACENNMDPDCVFQTQQLYWRLRQFYPSEYERASLISSVVQGIAVFAVGGLALRGATTLLRLFGVRLGAAAIAATEIGIASAMTSLELATWTANDLPPTDWARERRIRESARNGGLLGLASGLLLPGPKFARLK